MVPDTVVLSVIVVVVLSLTFSNFPLAVVDLNRAYPSAPATLGNVAFILPSLRFSNFKSVGAFGSLSYT